MALSQKTGGHHATYLYFALIVIGAALGNLSQTGLNAMLPAAMADFGVGIDVGQWLTTGYMLVLGIAVPLATFLSRRLGDRGYALLAFGLFAAGSLTDLLAPGFFSMLAGRILQAAAVGLLVPQLQTIAMMRFPPRRQATAMGIAGIALGFAPNIGPTAGGAMDSAFGWRSFFLLLLVASAVLLACTLALVKPAPAPEPDARLETPSLAYSTLGFGGVLLGLSQASSYGLASAWFWAPVAVGTMFLALFVRRQGRVASPLIRLGIFKSRAFRGGLLASVFLFACYMGVTLVIPLYVQDVLGGTSLDSGLVILPTTFTALLVNPLAGVLTDKLGPRTVALAFGLCLIAGSIACAFVGESTPLWLLSVLQTVRAIGVSGLIGPLLTFSLAGLDGPLVPDGSAASVVIRQVAATFGTALMVFAISSAAPLAGPMGLPAALPYQAAFAFSALMALACLAVIARRVR